MNATYYTSSGKVPPIGLIVTCIGGGVLALLLAVPYAAALVYNPSAYLGIVLPGLMGALIGGLVSKLGSMMKIRNVIALVGAGVLSSLACYGLSWVPWEWLTLNHLGQEIDLLSVMNPFTFIEIFSILYENGAWTIGNTGGAVSGVMLGLVWLCEVGIVLGASAVVAFGVASSGVFCETCDRWCTTVKNAFVHDAHAEPQITAGLALRQLGVLTDAPRGQAMSSQWVETAVYYCQCGVTNTLLVERCTRKVDRRGNQSIKRDAVVKHLMITKQEADWARNGR